MTLELLDSLTLDYPSLQLPTGPSSTSAFDPDQSYGQTQSFVTAARSFAAMRAEGASRDYPANVPVELSVMLADSVYLADPIGLWNHLDAELARKKKRIQETRQVYQDRIESLRSDAEIDGFAMNKASERDFWSFMKSSPFVRKAELVLLDNGNLRAIWDGKDDCHLGLQFLGERTVQYVVFRRRAGSSHLSRVAGRDTFEGVIRQVHTFELGAMLEV